MHLIFNILALGRMHHSFTFIFSCWNSGQLSKVTTIAPLHQPRSTVPNLYITGYSYETIMTCQNSLNMLRNRTAPKNAGQNSRRKNLNSAEWPFTDLLPEGGNHPHAVPSSFKGLTVHRSLVGGIDHIEMEEWGLTIQIFKNKTTFILSTYIFHNLPKISISIVPSRSFLILIRLVPELMTVALGPMLLHRSWGRASAYSPSASPPPPKKRSPLKKIISKNYPPEV